MRKLFVLAPFVMAGAAALAQPTATPLPTPLQRLEAALLRTTRSANATWGIYVKCLETGEEIALDADRPMDTMSTIKIPLMVEAFEQIKAGRFRLADPYTLQNEDVLPERGSCAAWIPAP